MTVTVGLFFTTETGSSYELNADAPLVRRLQNVNGRQPTPSQGPDGQWREYAALERFTWPDGVSSLVFIWADDKADTRTSPIVQAAPTIMELIGRLPVRRSWP